MTSGSEFGRPRRAPPRRSRRGRCQPWRRSVPRSAPGTGTCRTVRRARSRARRCREAGPLPRRGRIPLWSTPRVSTATRRVRRGRALDSGFDGTTADAIVSVDTDARLNPLQASFAVTALLAITALFGTGLLPRGPAVGHRAACTGARSGGCRARGEGESDSGELFGDLPEAARDRGVGCFGGEGSGWSGAADSAEAAGPGEPGGWAARCALPFRELGWASVCCGALGRIRTCDTRFRRAVLYPLSYEGRYGRR